VQRIRRIGMPGKVLKNTLRARAMDDPPRIRHAKRLSRRSRVRMCAGPGAL